MNTKTNCTMNASHTPGPWTYDNDWSLIMGPNGEEIAAIHAAQSQDEARCNRNTASSNAKLIASAPTLLAQRDELRAALQAIVAITNGSQPIDHRGACLVAQAALSNAKGDV